jgi:hypothetical protein
MAIINIKVPIKDTNYQQVLDAVCANGGYSDTVDDGTELHQQIPNPVTKEMFVIKQIKKILIEQKRYFVSNLDNVDDL